MTSSRLILVFLGIIFLIIVILSSRRIADALRLRFGSFFPSFTQIRNIASKTTPTPTPSIIITLSPQPTQVYGGTQTKGGLPTQEIPSTGPESFLYLLLGGSLATGLYLKRKS